jgi:L-ascorbate metabolism protein UlaG (beta-lactamase superfamily)
LSIDEEPEKNEILFTWFNRYAGVTVKTPSKTLVVDPVDVKSKSFKTVDAVLVTHEHYDHLDQALVAEIQKNTKCKVFADPTSARKLRTTVPKEMLTEVQVGSEVKLDGVIVRAEKSNHPPAATPVSFIVTSEDGVKVFHTSDSLPYPEMATVHEKGVEIAFLTKPKVAVPYHTGSTADQNKFAELLKKELPKTTCLIPEVGKIYQVSKRA